MLSLHFVNSFNKWYLSFLQSVSSSYEILRLYTADLTPSRGGKTRCHRKSNILKVFIVSIKYRCWCVFHLCMFFFQIESKMKVVGWCYELVEGLCICLHTAYNYLAAALHRVNHSCHAHIVLLMSM